MMRRIKSAQGFTLIELMMVIGIIGILAAVAMVSYRHFTEKAKTVEAEVALAEVERLERLHHANYGSYTNDLKAIGFSLTPALKFYRIEVRIQDAGAAFQALALPLVQTGNLQNAFVLSHAAGGRSSLTTANPGMLAQSGQGSGSHSAAMGPAGGGAQSGGEAQSKLGCQAGGEATLAADGMLDMNFCLQGGSGRNK